MSLPEPPEFKLPSPRLPILPRPPWEQEPTPIKIPGIAGGVVTAPKKGWNLIEYSDISNKEKVRFSVKPVIVALAEVRFGEILPVDAPTITVPSISLPRLSKIPRVARDDFNSSEYCNLVGSKARDGAKQISPPWPLDIIWGWFCDTLVYGLFYAAMFGIGFIINVLWDSFIQPQIDQVQGDIDAIQADFRNKLQTALNSVTGEIQSKVNEGLSMVIPVLYQMMAFAPGQLITPVNTQNVTTTSFEYYALSEGQKTHYIAVGIP